MKQTDRNSNPMDHHRDITPEAFRDDFERILKYRLVKETTTATDYDRFLALSYSVRDRLVENWIATQRTYREHRVKRVYYLSLEFLIGRTLGNSVINLQAEEAVIEAVHRMGMHLEEIRETEVDAGLGNGGLGRLAACFLDSLATLQIPAYGYGIRYDYGIFRQRIQNGHQVEEPDEWLARVSPWEVARPEYTFRVKFGGKVVSRVNRVGKTEFDWVDTEDILAMAYDIPVPGYANRTVNNLRLWSAKATQEFDLDIFNQGDYFSATSKKTESESISKVLYPNDNSPEGRELRLKQQYFFVAASLQDILRRYKREHKDIHNLAEFTAIQLNDTHPAISVAELMRILVDDEGLTWEEAWKTTRAVLAYTNHTLLPEALERWPVSLFGRLFPRHLQIIQEINARFLREVAMKYPGDTDRLRRMSLFEEGPDQHLRMAFLAIVGSHSVNGVSALHTELLRKNVVSDFNDMFPGLFNNKTNGITQRRWLRKANVELSRVISDRIGEGWITNLDELRKLEDLVDDPAFQALWREAKTNNKRRLAAIISEELGIGVPVEAMFDVQVKRIHEYKRQLLNVLHAIHLYLQIKSDPGGDHVPRVILFGGKAAPGYLRAKLIIKFINSVAEVVNKDPEIGERLKVVFLPDYRVSLAEKIIPACDLSEQISTAGKEASGTGNMKFALNGAMTIGTLDGANVEILEEVGEENIFIFGLKAHEVTEARAVGYDPRRFVERSANLRAVIDLISSGFFSPDQSGLFKPLVDSLLKDDEYMLMADFDEYVKCQDRVSELYRDTEAWTRMSILNVARMGKFSSDRTIEEYCRDIWKVQPVKIK
jgi:glycogen phosphorylase